MEFQRGPDPKKSIGVGLFRPREFETNYDAGIWVMQNHVDILGMPGLAKPYPSPEQFAKLREFVCETITITGGIAMDADEIVDQTAQLYRELNEIIGKLNIRI